MDTFWGYYTSSFEQRARDYAYQQSLTSPDPKLPEVIEGVVETVVDYYDD